MKHNEDVWGWMLAVDFFFAGMGGAALLLSGLAGLSGAYQAIPPLANLAGAVCVAIGAGFLILELGRPFQAWRVFMKPNTILTFGAWNMTAAIGLGLLYASFSLPALPWSGSILLRQIIALLLVLTGIIVATYPGVLLGRHKARPFWTGPGIMALFMLSSLATGTAVHLALASWSTTGEALLRPGSWLLAGLCIVQLVLWPGYVWIKRTGTTEREAQASAEWVAGKWAWPFWGGILGLGNLLPLVLLLANQAILTFLAAVSVLVGGVLMRWMVVSAGVHRTWLPGEQLFRARLPKGDEAFLHAWKR